MKVLLVDDDQLVLGGLRRMVDWAALDADIVGTAQNGEEALRLAQSNLPDVVITDVSMPVMDGLELSRRIRESMEGVHIFLISGHDDFEYARQAIRYGVENYILKPVTRETIRSLEGELEKIRRELAVRQEHYLKLWDAQRGREILNALRDGDEAFFDRLFCQIDRECSVSPDSTVTACLRLLDILYQYFSEIRVRADNIERSRRGSMEEMLALRGRGDKIGFVFQKYFDVLSEISSRKQEYSGTLALSAKKLADGQFGVAELNISYLADRLGCTPAYLSTVFRQSVGVNLSVYISSLRVERAKELLADPGRSIADVAQEVGYADAHYFAKLFKKKTGSTPSQFRNLAVRSDAALDEGREGR